MKKRDFSDNGEILLLNNKGWTLNGVHTEPHDTGNDNNIFNINKDILDMIKATGQGGIIEIKLVPKQ